MKEEVPDITTSYYKKNSISEKNQLNKIRSTEEGKILEMLNTIMDRLDTIEEKLDHSIDPYDLNDYFKAKNNQMPEGYTLVDSTSTDKINYIIINNNLDEDLISYKLSDRFDSTGAPI